MSAIFPIFSQQVVYFTWLALSKIDLLDIQTPLQEGNEAYNEGDGWGVTHHSLEATDRSVSTAYYILTGIDKLGKLCDMFSIEHNLALVAQNPYVLSFLGWVAFILGLLGTTIESLSIWRQIQTINCLDQIFKNSKDSDPSVADAVAELKKLKFRRFLKSLPLYLRDEVATLGDEQTKNEKKKFFDALEKKRGQGSEQALSLFLYKIKLKAEQKELMHKLLLLSSGFAILAAILAITLCPPIACLVIACISVVLFVASVIVSKGLVENPEDEFNWKLCLPEFLRKKKIVHPQIVESPKRKEVYDLFIPVPRRKQKIKALSKGKKQPPYLDHIDWRRYIPSKRQEIKVP